MERVLFRLSRLNRTGVFLATIGLVFVGLLLPGIAGAVLLLALVAAMAWVLTRTWAVQHGGTRTYRVLILAFLTAMAIAKLI